MTNKRGTHVGFVVSFVIFITFIVFMYFLLSSRVDFGQQKANSLEYVKTAITEKISGNLTTASIAINQANPQSCVQLRDFFLNTAGIADRFIVRSDSGGILVSSKSGNDLFVQRDGNLFFRIYGSEEFNLGSQGTINPCQPLNEGTGYSFGLIRDSENVFESKVIRLLDNYTADYQALKNDMQIGERDEFGFRFIYSNGTELITPEKNLTINIYIGRIPVQYIKTDAATESGFVDAIVW